MHVSHYRLSFHFYFLECIPTEMGRPVIGWGGLDACRQAYRDISHFPDDQCHYVGLADSPIIRWHAFLRQGVQDKHTSLPGFSASEHFWVQAEACLLVPGRGQHDWATFSLAPFTSMSDLPQTVGASLPIYNF